MTSVRILGVDPGLNRTGWGIVDSDGNRLIHVAHGVVSSNVEGNAASLAEGQSIGSGATPSASRNRYIRTITLLKVGS